MIHRLADVQTNEIGNGTNIWQNCVILPNAKIGCNCNICANCFIENDVVIGNNVTIKCGVSIWDGITIGNDVFIGPSVAFTNDKFPRSKKMPPVFAKTIIEHGASIGANATILPVKIGKYAMIGAGSVITKDVPPYAIVTGNPGRITGYVDTNKISVAIPNESMIYSSGNTGARIYRIPQFSDARGSLNVIDAQGFLPFQIKRVFYTYNVPSKDVRGEHAHKKCEQFLVAVNGSLSVIVDNGKCREEFLLNSPSIGLYVPAGCWGIQYKHSPDSVLMVLASLPYDKDDYIRNYADYKSYIGIK